MRWHRLAGLPSGRRGKWLFALGWLVLVAAISPLASKLFDATNDDETSYLPHSAESTRVVEKLADFDESDMIPAVIVYERDGGVGTGDEAAVERDRRELADLAAAPIEDALPSDDGAARLLVVPLPEDDKGLSDTVDEVRDIAAADVPDGLDVKVTGPASGLVDLTDSFSGLDSTLLLVAASVVAVLLLITYRSPVLWAIPLLSVGIASQLGNAVVYLLARHTGMVVSSQSAGVLTVLMFGVGTDYALLLVSRYREELHLHPDRHVAMAVALRRSAPAVLASAGTVIIATLCLLASEMNSNRGLGPVAAIGVACAVLAMVTLLPALLVVCGRWVFWPFIPRERTPSLAEHGVWSRLGGRIERRPRLVWAGGVVVLGALALGLTGARTGLSGEDAFVHTTDTIRGQRILAEHYPSGQSTPVDVVANAAAESDVVAAVESTDGVDHVTGTTRSGDLTHLEVVLTDAPDSEAAMDTVDRLRDSVHAVPNADALVGGGTATTLDTNRALGHDNKVIVPIVLGAILIILALLLRALVAPLLLVATVVLSYLASLGASTVLFRTVFGFDALDPGLPLAAFIFLVALGTDYNIFLMTRIREEAGHIGHRAGVRRGLAVTGGVITSAGVVLAATFCALTVLPLTAAVEQGVLIAFGVLLDTFLVRSVLVPALAFDVGRATWWPSRLSRRADGPGRRPEPTDVVAANPRPSIENAPAPR